MPLLPQNAELANRGLRAAFVDADVPKFPGHRPEVALAIVEVLRAMMHTCDRYGLDLPSLLAPATAYYYEDEADDPEVTVPDRVEPGRNIRAAQSRRRTRDRRVPVPGRERRTAPRPAPRPEGGRAEPLDPSSLVGTEDGPAEGADD